MLNNQYKNNYRFEIPDNRLSETFLWQIQSVSFPGVQMQTAKVAYSPKIADTEIPGTGTTFEDMQVTFILDEELLAYSELFSWMLTVQNPHGPTTENAINTPKTALFHIMDNIKENIVCTFRMHGLFPKALGEIEWAYNEAGDVETMTCMVTFGYKFFEMSRRINGIDKLITPRLAR